MTKSTEKISCIDIGSNAIKYRQYRLINKELIELDTFKRISLRLGTDAFNEGKMLEKTYQEFYLVLKKLKKHAKKKETELIITSFKKIRFEIKKIFKKGAIIGSMTLNSIPVI